METFSALLVLCEGNPPVTGGFPSQSPVTQNFDVFFDLRLNKLLSKQSRRWWFETLSRSLWHHYNDETQQNTTQQSETGCTLLRMICNLRHGLMKLIDINWYILNPVSHVHIQPIGPMLMERLNMYLYMLCSYHTNKDQQLWHLGGLSTISLHHESIPCLISDAPIWIPRQILVYI